MICPECGVDLQKAGVVPADRGRSVASRMSVAGLVLLFALGAIPLSRLLLKTLIPFTETQEISRRIVCNAPLNETIEVICGHRFWQPPIMKHPLMAPEKFILSPSGTHGLMKVNLKTGEYSYLSDKPPAAQWKTGTGFSTAIVAEWLGEKDNNSNDPRVRDFAEAVCAAVNEIAAGNSSARVSPLLDRNGVQIGTLGTTVLWIGHDDPNGAAYVILALPWLGLGIYGYLRTSRRWGARNRLLADYHLTWLGSKVADIPKS